MRMQVASMAIGLGLAPALPAQSQDTSLKAVLRQCLLDAAQSDHWRLGERDDGPPDSRNSVNLVCGGRAAEKLMERLKEVGAVTVGQEGREVSVVSGGISCLRPMIPSFETFCVIVIYVEKPLLDALK